MAARLTLHRIPNTTGYSFSGLPVDVYREKSGRWKIVTPMLWGWPKNEKDAWRSWHKRNLCNVRGQEFPRLRDVRDYMQALLDNDPIDLSRCSASQRQRLKRRPDGSYEISSETGRLTVRRADDKKSWGLFGPDRELLGTFGTLSELVDYLPVCEYFDLGGRQRELDRQAQSDTGAAECVSSD